jgi:CTP synthase (UTP-ammonia lyase)
MTVARIAVIGDYQPGNPTHESVAHAIAHSGASEGSLSSVQWIPTEDAERATDQDLRSYSGFWIAPGSPYRSIRGALNVIRYAREHDVPLLGTCGGFQHVILEFARNVLGFTDAAHAEYDPYASNLFITALTCSLVGQTMTVALQPGTRAATIYPAPTSAERYYCNFGLNPQHLGALLDAGLVVSGVDQDGEARIVEIPGLKYFLATLFVPQTSSTPEMPHPIVTTFIQAACDELHR